MKMRNAAIAMLVGWIASLAGAALADGPAPVVVRTAMGGFILGYDIDRNGTEGLLAEAVTRPDGRHDIAIETFDQRTGAIIEIVRRQTASRNAFSVLGIFGDHVGLAEFEHASGLFVDRRRYGMLNPLSANAFTARWTPPFSSAADIITAAAESQGFANTAMLGFRIGSAEFSSYVFAANVGANLFGPVIRVTNPVFDTNNSPVIAINQANRQAILGGSFGCFGCPTEIGFVDLETGAQTSFRGLGIGYVNGIAVDSEHQVVCTTTEDDFSVEFYDLVSGESRIVPLPGATSQLYSGQAVAFDPVHRLFFVAQQFSSTAFRGSSIHVYDVRGNHVKSLDGFHLPASATRIALNPARRAGYVLVAPDLNTLQSFTY